MLITAFSNFTDGLDPNRRSREHFIANTNHYREAGLDVREPEALVR
jgi:hypothetical protein